MKPKTLLLHPAYEGNPDKGGRHPNPYKAKGSYPLGVPLGLTGSLGAALPPCQHSEPSALLSLRDIRLQHGTKGLCLVSCVGQAVPRRGATTMGGCILAVTHPTPNIPSLGEVSVFCCAPAPLCRQAKPHFGAVPSPPVSPRTGAHRAGWVTIVVKPVPAPCFPPPPLLAVSLFHPPLMQLYPSLVRLCVCLARTRVRGERCMV